MPEPAFIACMLYLYPKIHINKKLSTVLKILFIINFLEVNITSKKQLLKQKKLKKNYYLKKQKIS